MRNFAPEKAKTHHGADAPQPDISLIMKTTFLSSLCLLLALVATPLRAQDVQPVAISASETQKEVLRFGTLRYDSLLHAMPEYATMQTRLADLRAKYEKEIDYNEETFKRQFAEFLQGQKEFPQNILLKRQRDLQAAMERSLAFRHEADSLLSQAAIDLEAPIRQRLNAAIQAVGLERGYAGIVNLDTPSMPFVNPRLTEDATPYVVEKLILTRDR